MTAGIWGWRLPVKKGTGYFFNTGKRINAEVREVLEIISFFIMSKKSSLSPFHPSLVVKNQFLCCLLL